jgi:Holliday junction DNA helicase RuvA
MIGRLTGTLAQKRAPRLLIDCNGVGYEVDVSMSTYYQLPAEGDRVSIWTHLQIKDDAHTLIGFYSEQERGLFRQLIKVNGVGPKMALTILSGISESDFIQCIRQADIATLTRLPGVGKKTAERLIVEMKDKVAPLGGDTPGGGPRPGSAGAANACHNEAAEALQALGYKPADASRMVSAAAKQIGDDSAEALIKQALQQAVKR